MFTCGGCMNGAKVPKMRINSAFLWVLNPINQFEPPYEPPCCNRVIVSRVSLQGIILRKFRYKLRRIFCFYILVSLSLKKKLFSDII